MNMQKGKHTKQRTRGQSYCLLNGFVLILLFALILNIGAINSTETVSVQENRPLETYPQLSAANVLSGDYFLQWERYIVDHVPGRALFLNVVNHIETAMAWNGGDTVRIETVPADIGVQQVGASQTQEILVLENRVREIFHQDEAVAEQYINAVNAYAHVIPDDIVMFHMLVPMPIAFEEEKYQTVSDYQKTAIESIYQRLDERIHTIGVYSLLEKHCDEALYFRTDHHWTALGARYGAEAFAEAAQIALPPIDLYQTITLYDYIGQLGQAHLTDGMRSFPDEVQYYLYQGNNNLAKRYYYASDDNNRLMYFEAPMIQTDFADERGDYGIFLSGDYPCTVIEGNADSNRVLAIVKDSYGNAFAPWMTENFAKILCIDPRSCHENLNALLTEYQVTDFLLLNYAKATSLPAYCELLSAYAQ